MKRYLLLCALVALVVSCTKGTGDTEKPITKGPKIEVGVGMPSTKYDTRVETDYKPDANNNWIFTWKDTDDVEVLYTDEENWEGHRGDIIKYRDMLSGPIEISSDRTGALFTGQLSHNPIESSVVGVRCNIALLHLDGATFDEATRKLSLATEQNGDLSSIAMLSPWIDTHDRGEDGSIKVEGKTLNHLTSIVILNFKFKNIPSTWGDVKIEKIVVDGFVTSAIIDPLGMNIPTISATNYYDYYSSIESKPITVTPKAATSIDGKLYINILPTWIRDWAPVVMNIYFSNGKHIEYTKLNTSGGEKFFERGTYNTINVECDLAQFN